MMLNRPITALAATPTLAFQAVSARYHSAELAVTIDAAKVTSAQLARTRQLPGVTGAFGYPATTVSITIPGTPGYRGGDRFAGRRGGGFAQLGQQLGHAGAPTTIRGSSSG